MTLVRCGLLVQVEPEPLLHALFVRDIEVIGVWTARPRRRDLLNAAIASIAEAPPYHDIALIAIGSAQPWRSANINSSDTLVRLTTPAIASLRTAANCGARRAVFVGLAPRFAGIGLMANRPRKSRLLHGRDELCHGRNAVGNALPGRIL